MWYSISSNALLEFSLYALLQALGAFLYMSSADSCPPFSVILLVMLGSMSYCPPV